ncbi:hypothetical protein SGLAM104S_07873 [Streptomyces glaucescens]
MIAPARPRAPTLRVPPRRGLVPAPGYPAAVVVTAAAGRRYAVVREQLHAHFPDREAEVVTDLRAAAGDSDIVLATAGPGTPASVDADWLKPAALSVLVGYGIAPSTLHRADRVIATSAAQMRVTGTDMADAGGELRAVDAEFPEVLAGRAAGRTDPGQRIFAYNSGLVVTDIALGHRFAQLALAQGLGTAVPLWQRPRPGPLPRPLPPCPRCPPGRRPRCGTSSPPGPCCTS